MYQASFSLHFFSLYPLFFFRHEFFVVWTIPRPRVTETTTRLAIPTTFLRAARAGPTTLFSSSALSIRYRSEPANLCDTLLGYDRPFRFLGIPRSARGGSEFGLNQAEWTRSWTASETYLSCQGTSISATYHIYKMAPTMQLALHTAGLYQPTSDALDRHEYGVHKSKKPASTGGGRAWSEDEV